jgi:hypothetical protein
MKRQYRCAISTLRRAIALEDATTAMEMAKQLLPLRDQIRIEAGSPVFYYRGDPSTRSRCTAMSVSTGLSSAGKRSASGRGSPSAGRAWI